MKGTFRSAPAHSPPEQEVRNGAQAGCRHAQKMRRAHDPVVRALRLMKMEQACTKQDKAQAMTYLSPAQYHPVVSSLSDLIARIYFSKNMVKLERKSSEQDLYRKSSTAKQVILSVIGPCHVERQEEKHVVPIHGHP